MKYAIPLKFSTSPAWSLAPRHPAQRPSDLPGPGAYEPKLKGTTAAKLGTETRTARTNREEVPGPGSYNPGLKKSGSAPR